MPAHILSPRSRVSPAQAEKLLKCYAARLSPTKTAKQTGLSLNTVYEQYSRLRWRLIEVGYYSDAARSKDEAGLGPEAKKLLGQRRSLSEDDSYAHAAEAIEWAEEWPAGLVLRHLRKIVALTGPIDRPLNLNEIEAGRATAYVRYARTRLLHDRVKTAAQSDDTHIPFRDLIKQSLDQDWRNYRAASKRAQREG